MNQQSRSSGDNAAEIVRKKHTGEPGNGGQFGATDREPSGITLSEDPQRRPVTSADWTAAADSAMDQFHAAREAMERTSMGALVTAIRDAYPDAQHLALDYSDQGDYWAASELWGDDRETIADADDLYDLGDEGSIDMLLSNIGDSTDYDFIETAPDGRQPRLNLSKALDWAHSGGTQ